MIQNKSDLVLFLESDKIALDRKRMRPSINDEIWRYQIALRKCEYFQNCSNNMFMKIQGCVWRIIKHHLGVKCGFSIPNNVIGPGLCLAHIGPIIISPYAKIGENCRIHVGVNIGADARNSRCAPQIGNRVYIGPGAKIFRDILIADEIAVGANAVVTKSFEDPGVSIAGVPAKIINHNGVQGIL